MVVRKYEDELQFIERINEYSWRIKKGFQVMWQIKLPALMKWAKNIAKICKFPINFIILS